MRLNDIPFGVTDWSQVPTTAQKGEQGVAYWQTCCFGGVRVRLVRYTAGYKADHWCSKGHILLCLEGELETELVDGRRFRLSPCKSYQVSDDTNPHRSSTATGATLFVVD